MKQKIEIIYIQTDAEKQLYFIAIKYKNVIMFFEFKLKNANNIYNKWVYYTMTNKHTKPAYNGDTDIIYTEECAKSVSKIYKKISSEFQDDLRKMIKDLSDEM